MGQLVSASKDNHVDESRILSKNRAKAVTGT